MPVPHWCMAGRRAVAVSWFGGVVTGNVTISPCQCYYKWIAWHYIIRCKKVSDIALHVKHVFMFLRLSARGLAKEPQWHGQEAFIVCLKGVNGNLVKACS